MTDSALAETRAWVDRAVIGLHLCPFARAPQSRGQIRFVVSAARDRGSLLRALVDELVLIVAEPPERIETTLLIHPHALADFGAYNDFLAEADDALVALGLEGEIQIASFHPDYRFAGSAADDIANATNRSPHPMLHLLREASVEKALAGVTRPEAIFEANIATMQRIGVDGWAALRRQCREDAVAVGRGDADTQPDVC